MDTTVTMEEIENMDYDEKLLGALELLPDVSDEKLNLITEILLNDE